MYLLTVVTPLDHPGTEFEVISDGRSAQTATLEDLARWTGGDMRIASTPAHTSDAIQDLFTELRYQYLISSSLENAPGGIHSKLYAEEGSCRPRARRVMSGLSRSGS